MSDAHEVAVRAVADVLAAEGVDGPVTTSKRALAALDTPEVRAALVGAIESCEETCHAGSPRGISDLRCYVPVDDALNAVLDALAGAERGERG